MSTPVDVRALRERLDKTQSEFAELLGVDQGTISNWETGKTTPRGPALKVMERLASPAKAGAA